MIVGIDVGRCNTKLTTDKDEILFTTAYQIETTEGINDNWIEIDGKRFAVGIGTGLSKDNKSLDEAYEVCLLYALSKVNDSAFKIVTGLPIAHYKSYKDNIEQKYRGKKYKIKTTNTSKDILIEDIRVAPEGIFCNTEKLNDSILIDIGGYTVDVALFEDGKLTKADTMPLGMNTMYAHISAELRKKGSDCDSRKIQSYISRGHYVLDGELIQFDSYSYRKSHFDMIVEKIRNNFPLKSSILTFIGGGANVFSDILKENNYPIPPNDTIFSNARAFKVFGESIWQKR